MNLSMDFMRQADSVLSSFSDAKLTQLFFEAHFVLSKKLLLAPDSTSTASGQALRTATEAGFLPPLGHLSSHHRARLACPHNRTSCARQSLLNIYRIWQCTRCGLSPGGRKSKQTPDCLWCMVFSFPFIWGYSAAGADIFITHTAISRTPSHWNTSNLCRNFLPRSQSSLKETIFIIVTSPVQGSPHVRKHVFPNSYRGKPKPKRGMT